MSAIRSKGRRGFTAVPNWRLEDDLLTPYEFRLAAWLASHADSFVEEYLTRNAIAKRLGMSTGAVSNAMERLQGFGIVEIQTVEIHQSQGGKRWVIIFDHDVWETEPGHHMTGPRSPRDQDPGHHVTSTTGDIDVEQQEEPPNPPEGGVSVVDPWERAFDLWYADYPRKVGRPAAERAFKKKVSGMSTGQMLALAQGTARWVEHWDRTRIEAQFIPHPSTFLNQERYNDVPAAGNHRRDAMDLLRDLAGREGSS